MQRFSTARADDIDGGSFALDGRDRGGIERRRLLADG
jgi:hypothetical protein